MLNTVIGVVVCLAAVLAALQVVGSRMEETHVAEGSADVPGSPSAVAARLRDVASQPSWRPSVAKIEVLGHEGGVIRYRETGKNGALTFAFREIERDHTFESRIDDVTLPFGGRWLITLAPVDSNTRVTIREEGFVKPPLFRVLSKYVFGHDGTLKSYLKDLRASS